MGVLPSSHAYWAARLARRAADRRAWFSLGSVTPDLPGMVIGTALVLRGAGREDLVPRTYEHPPWKQVHLGVHSLLPATAVWGATTPGGRLRALADGWLSHIAVDLVSHRDDSWPPLWPLSARRLYSPVSYWQGEHHGRAWGAIEAVARSAAVATDRLRVRRWAGLGALAVVVLSLATERGERRGVGQGV